MTYIMMVEPSYSNFHFMLKTKAGNKADKIPKTIHKLPVDFNLSITIKYSSRQW